MPSFIARLLEASDRGLFPSPEWPGYRRLCISVASVAFWSTAGTLFVSFPEVPTGDIPGIAVWIAILAVAIRLRRAGDREQSVDITALPLTAVILHFSPPIAVLVVVLAGIVGRFTVHREKLPDRICDTMIDTLAAAAGGWTFVLAAGTLSVLGEGATRALLAAAAGCSAFVGLQTTLRVAASNLRDERPVFNLLSSAIRLRWASDTSVLALGCLAGLFQAEHNVVVGLLAVIMTAVAIQQLWAAKSQTMWIKRATLDPLTKLVNRGEFERRIVEAIERAKQSGRRLAVLYLDLDNFKGINDTLGHQAGDELLEAVAQRIRASIRPGDIAARRGGDEFAVSLEDIGSIEQACAIAERIILELEAPFVVARTEVFTSTSIGIAFSDAGVVDATNVLCNADLAMYQSKTSGKSRWSLYQPSLSASARERLDLEQELRRGLAGDEIQVLYQPVVDIKSRLVVEMEATPIWQHPKRGMLESSEFMPFAEEIGLAGQLGQRILDQACRDAAGWPVADVAVAVRLSARQVVLPNIADVVHRSLDRAGLPPERLRLQIPERAAFAASQAGVLELWKISAQGVKIAVVDFGASLAGPVQLRLLPTDSVKVDWSLVRELGDDIVGAAIADSIVNVARSLKLAVTVGSVESPDQLAYLQLLGCTRGQGKLFAPPLESEHALELLDRMARQIAARKQTQNRVA